MESFRLGDWALQRLFILSDLFIIALCTKPPIPFVAEKGRSDLSGEMRPCEGDIANPRVSVKESELGGSSLWASVIGRGEPIPVLEFPWYDMREPLPN